MVEVDETKAKGQGVYGIRGVVLVCEGRQWKQQVCTILSRKNGYKKGVVVAAKEKLGVEEDNWKEYQLSGLEDWVDGGTITEIGE